MYGIPQHLCQMDIKTAGGTGSFPTVARADPTKRYSALMFIRSYVEWPIEVSGIGFPLASAPTMTTTSRAKVALFASDGQMWTGTASTDTGLPTTAYGSMANSITWAAAQSAYQTSATPRGFKFALDSATRISQPGPIWIALMTELIYLTPGTDTQVSTAVYSRGADLIIHPTETTGAGGNGRNLFWNALLGNETVGMGATDDTSLAWSTFAGAAKTSFTQTSGTTVSLSAITVTVGQVQNWSPFLYGNRI
jgi:hypothetical protein